MSFLSGAKYVIFEEPKSDPTVEKIGAYAAYKAGWNYGEGEAFTKEQIDRALKIRELMQQIGYTATDAFPGLVGEIAVTAYKDSYFLQFIVEPGNVASLLVKNGADVVVREYHIAETRARYLFLNASRTVWGISEELISRSTTTLGLSESTPWRLDTRGTQQRFPFSYATA